MMTMTIGKAALRFGMVGMVVALAGCGAAPQEIAVAEEALSTPVPSVQGLPGSYYRTTAVNEMMSISLSKTASDGGRISGVYTRIITFSNIESGTFISLPDNPLIGPVLHFKGNNGTETTYFIEGVTTDSLGRITTLQLQRDSSPAFIMTRTF